MSKSLDNYIAIEDTPREMFGKTMRVSDELMVRYYELLTDLSVQDLDQMKADLANGKLHPKSAKVNLAKFWFLDFIVWKKPKPPNRNLKECLNKRDCLTICQFFK